MTNQRAEIQFEKGILPNAWMNTGNPGIRGDIQPAWLRRIRVDKIEIGERLRKSIPASEVAQLRADIGTHGLLHPIGVQQIVGGPTKYRLIYGHARLKAFQAALKDAHAANDIKAIGTWETIPAVIYDGDMPKTFALLKEIAENLFRTTLTKPQVEEHRAKYAAILKRADLTIAAIEKRAESKKAGRKSSEKSTSSPGSDFRENSQSIELTGKPTTIEKMAGDLGITDRQIRHDFQSLSKRAQTVAKAEGLPVPKRITTESSAKEIEHVVALAERQTEAKQKAQAKGTDPRKVYPIQPEAHDQITVRIDITDPAQLLDWFKMRLQSQNKPLSIRYLRSLHQGLGKLIAETGK